MYIPERTYSRRGGGSKGGSSGRGNTRDTKQKAKDTVDEMGQGSGDKVDQKKGLFHDKTAIGMGAVAGAGTAMVVAGEGDGPIDRIRNSVGDIWSNITSPFRWLLIGGVILIVGLVVLKMVS